MIRKKICIIGSFAVGKTSLVQRYVHGIFSDKYLTTLGVKIDKKSIWIADKELQLIVWDLAGEDEFIRVRNSYLQGAAGYLLVVDGTRRETLDTARDLKGRIDKDVAELPFVTLLNKSDLKNHWTIERSDLEELQNNGWMIMETSAKNSENVEEAFMALALRLINEND